MASTLYNCGWNDVAYGIATTEGLTRLRYVQDVKDAYHERLKKAQLVRGATMDAYCEGCMDAVNHYLNTGTVPPTKE